MDKIIPHILIVDDDANLLETMRDILKLKGFAPVTAQTGAAALVQLGEHSFDLALIDLRLDDMSGLKILEAIKIHSPETECILLTGHASQNTAIEAIQMGVYGYFQKPFDMEQVLLSIQRAIEKGAAGKALWESERFAHATVDALSSHLAILDETGAILAVNRAWREFAKANSAEVSNLKVSEGANYLTVCDTSKGVDSEEASAIAVGIRAVMSGRQKEFSLEYPCHSPEEKRWFIARVTRFSGEGSMRIVVAHENITERKLAEVALRQSEQRYRGLFEDSPVAIWEEDFSKLKNHLDSLKQQGVTDFRAYFESHPEAIFEYTELIKILDVNNAAMKMYGAESREKLLESTHQFLSKGERAHLQEDLCKIAEGKTSNSWEGGDETVTGEPIEISLSWSVSPGHEDDFSKVIVTTIDITQRKQAEEALQNSEKRFRALIENGRDNISLLAADGTLLWESPSTISTLGYAPNQFVGRNIFELMHPDDLSPIQDQYTQILKTPDRKLDGIFRLRHNNGTWLWIESTAANMLNEPSVQAIVINYRDITERKQAEEKLAQTEERFRSLIENAPDGVVLIGLDGNYKYASPAALRMFGYSVEDAQGHNPANDTHPEDLPMVLQVLQDLITNPSKVPTIQYRFMHKDGSWRWIESTFTNLLAELRVEAIVINFHDITERKQAEDKLRILSRALEQSPTSIVITDPQGNIEYINPKFSQVTGYALEEAISKNPRILKSGHTTEVEYKKLWDTITSGNVWQGEFLNTKKNGEKYWENALITPIFNDEQKISNFLAMKEDITERKHAQEAQKQSELQFRALFELSPDAVMLIDPHDPYISWPIVDCNTAACQMNGYYRDELIGHSIDIVNITPGAQAERNDYMNRLREAGSLNLETFHRHKNGAIFPIEVSTALIQIGDRELMIGIDRDITERKQNENTLMTERNLLRTLIDILPDYIFVKDVNNRLILNNIAHQRYLGATTLEDVIGKTDFDFFPKEIAALFIADEQKIIRSGEAMIDREEQSVDKNSNQRWLLTTKVPLRNLQGIITGIVGINHDITERKQVEDELRQSEQRFQQLANNIQETFWITDAKSGREIYISPAAEKVWGIPVEDLYQGRYLFLENILPEDRQVALDAIERQSHGAKTEMEYRIQHPDGSVHWIWDRAFPILDETGKVLRVTGLAADVTERKQIELALGESQRRLTILMANLPGMAFRCKNDEEWSMDFVSEGCYSLTGYHPAELINNIGIAYGQIIHSEDRQMVWNVIQTKLEEKQPYQLNYRITTASGNMRWVWEQGQGVYGADGDLIALEGFIADITERKQAEEALRESETLYRQAIEVAGAVPYLQSYNTNGTGIHYDFIGDGIHQITGYGAEEFNVTLWDSLTQESILLGDLAGYSLEQAIQRVRSGGIPLWKCEHRIHARDGKIHWVFEAAVELYAENGVAKGSIGMFQDITERKQAEGNIRQHIKELELLYETGLMFSQLLNPREIAQKIINLLGEKMDWHHTTIRLIRAQDELELVAFDQPGLEDKAAVEAHFKNLITHVGEGLSGWALQQSKTIRLGDVSSDPHYIATYPDLHSGLYVPLKSNDHILGVISIESSQPNAFSEADEQLLTTLANQAANAFENARLYEETNRYAQELEQRVQERTADLSIVNADLARAVRVKDEFLASMSHELRTPLTGILGLSEVLQLKIYGELNDKQRATLKNIEESGRHLLELINDILDLSKIEAGKLDLQFEPYSIGDICQASLQLTKGMAQHKHQHVNYSPPAEPIIIRADARRLKQMLVNLLSNAIKFTPENGELGLEVQADESERKVKLIVWDKGIGIKPEDMDTIFKPFTQLDGGLAREYSGTGLGLSLVQHLIELHNGGIEVESNIGQGSRFIIVLPWSPQNTTPLPYNMMRHGNTGGLNISALFPKHSKSPLVMYVDDNEMVLQMVGDFLEAQHYRVIKVRNGLELLERAAEAHPNIMLVDIQMPGIGGLETIRRIRAHPDPLIAAAPVIAVTALAMPADRERCLRAGANDYMSKPLKLKELAATIQRLLERK